MVVMANIALAVGVVGIGVSIIVGILDCLKSDTYDNTGLLPYFVRKEVNKAK